MLPHVAWMAKLQSLHSDSLTTVVLSQETQNPSMQANRTIVSTLYVVPFKLGEMGCFGLPKIKLTADGQQNVRPATLK